MGRGSLYETRWRFFDCLQPARPTFRVAGRLGPAVSSKSGFARREEARKNHEDGWKGFLTKQQPFLGDLEWVT
jgi:hypothetical protein